jgi:hypothetical protein
MSWVSNPVAFVIPAHAGIYVWIPGQARNDRSAGSPRFARDDRYTSKSTFLYGNIEEVIGEVDSLSLGLRPTKEVVGCKFFICFVLKRTYGISILEDYK